MTYVLLDNYSDGKSENIYTGEDLMQAVRAFVNHHSSGFRLQIWNDGTMIEELTK